MTIIVFLIDTSGSMNQRTHNGARSTLLDVAKETIEKIIRLRQRDQSSRSDRYMLLTFDETPYNIKAGWKENLQVFLNELKNLSANGVTNMGHALKNTFDYLNLNRMVSGIDTYGAGRCPYYNETAIIINITDGAKYSNTSNVSRELILPMNTFVPGSELTQEPFRWDHRLYSLVLRLRGTYSNESTTEVTNGLNSVPCNVPADDSHIDIMCTVTGGRSYSITSIKALNASLENLVSRMHSGVVLWFQRAGGDPMPVQHNDDDNFDTSKFANYDAQQYGKAQWTNLRNLIYVRSEPRQKACTYGNWPIPEAFNVDMSHGSLPPRTAQPVIKFICTNAEPALLPTFPFDKYELDPSPLTQVILSRRQPNVAWQCYIQNNSRPELVHPFGYLKASSTMSCVNLYVMPYNYPVVLPLINEYMCNVGKVSREWRQQFENYIKTMPIYYGSSLKKALSKYSLNANLFPIPDMEALLNTNLNNFIKKQKNAAKIEAEKLSNTVGLVKHIPIDWPRATTSALFQVGTHGGRKVGGAAAGDFSYCSNPVLKRVFSNLQSDQDFTGFVIRYKEKPKTHSKMTTNRNPFDVDRHDMITQLNKLRDSYFQKQTTSIRCQDEDVLHNLPVGQMGNYTDYIKKLPPPLRELESAPTRQHMFGNPFKLDKKNPMLIDEADMADMAPGSPGAGSGGPNGGSLNGPPGNMLKVGKRSADGYTLALSKKKKGPIPRDLPYYRTPPPSPSPHRMSPVPMNGFYGLGPSTPPPPTPPQMLLPTPPSSPLPSSTSPIQSFTTSSSSPPSSSPTPAFSPPVPTTTTSAPSSMQPTMYIPQHLKNALIDVSPTTNSGGGLPNGIINNNINHKPPTVVVVNGNDMHPAVAAAPNANKINHTNSSSKFYNENNFSLLTNNMMNSGPNRSTNAYEKTNNLKGPATPTYRTTHNSSPPVVNGNAWRAKETPRPLSIKGFFNKAGSADGPEKYAFNDYHLLMLDTYRKKNLSREDFEKKVSLLKQVQNYRNDHNVLIKSLASVPGYFGEYLLFEVFETAVRFKLTPLLHKLRDSFPDKGDHLFRMYNLPTTSPEKLANIGATSKAASSNHSSV